MNNLESLRKMIAEIDNNLIKLIKKRFEIANEIGRIKRSKGLPLKNWEVEKNIIQDTKKKAEKIGISKEFMVGIMQEIIKESCAVQEIFHYRKFEKGKENIFIVGANGKMGKWFSEFFQVKGHNILKYDIEKPPDDDGFCDFEFGLKNSSITFITTPIKTIPSIIDKIIDFGYKGVVSDIASIKTCLIDIYQKAIKNGISITSIHPLFGPNAKILSDKIMCLCDLGDIIANKKIKSLFNDTAISVFKTSVENHDYIISYVLNLSHIINIIYIDVLSKSGFDFKSLKLMGSTTFFSQIKTSKSVIAEDPDLYFDIQTLNKYENKILEELNKSAEKIIETIIRKKSSEFKEIMKKGKRWIQR